MIVTRFPASKVADSGVEAPAYVHVLFSVSDSPSTALSTNLGSPLVVKKERSVVMSARKGAQDRSSEAKGVKGL